MQGVEVLGEQVEPVRCRPSGHVLADKIRAARVLSVLLNLRVGPAVVEAQPCGWSLEAWHFGEYVPKRVGEGPVTRGCAGGPRHHLRLTGSQDAGLVHQGEIAPGVLSRDTVAAGGVVEPDEPGVAHPERRVGGISPVGLIQPAADAHFSGSFDAVGHRDGEVIAGPIGERVGVDGEPADGGCGAHDAESGVEAIGAEGHLAECLEGGVDVHVRRVCRKGRAVGKAVE